MTGEHPTKFYARMMRNLGILRDIQRLIDDGRKSYRNTIEFDDEKGNVWKLQKVGVRGRQSKDPAKQAQYLSRSDTKPQNGSGFQYGFTFDEDHNSDDIAFTKEGVTLLVDPLSFQYLMGAEVDYTENLQGAQFVIRNPNAATTCGCGSSFSV